MARIDKFLWSTRLFKTRTIAADACKMGRVMIGGSLAKASREVKEGDVLQIRKRGIVYSFKILQLTQNRMGAKLVPEYLKNVTTPDQLELIEQQKLRGFTDRAKGLGRPTKRDRRDLDDFTQNEEWFFDEFEEWEEEMEELTDKG